MRVGQGRLLTRRNVSTCPLGFSPLSVKSSVCVLDIEVGSVTHSRGGGVEGSGSDDGKG